METLYFLFFMRLLQFIGLLFVIGGLRNMPVAATAVAKAIAGQTEWPHAWGVIAAVAGRLWGGGLTVWVLQYFINQERKLRVGQQELPDEPWRINPMWAEKRIRLSNRTAIVGLSIAAAVFLTVFVPLAISLNDRKAFWWLGGLGVLWLLFARAAWMNRKWNQAEFRLAHVPGIIGGPLTGVVILHEDFRPGTSFEVSLRCMRSNEKRSRAVYSEDHTEGSAIWSSVLYIDKPLATIQRGTTAIPVSFAIPIECAATTLKPVPGQRPVRWKLHVNVKNEAALGGCAFEVPVFRTAESRPDFELAEELVAPFHEDVDVPTVLQRVHWQRKILPSGSESWEFSLLDPVGLCIVLGVTAASAVGLWAAIMWFRASPFTAFGGFFAAVFLFIGLYTLAEMLLWRSSVEIGDTWLTIESGYWGFRRRVTVPRDQTTHLTCQMEFRKGNGEWWRIAARPSVLLDPATKEVIARDEDSEEEEEEHEESGVIAVSMPTLQIARRLDGRVEAEKVQAWMAEQLGVSSSTSLSGQN